VARTQALAVCVLLAACGSSSTPASTATATAGAPTASAAVSGCLGTAPTPPPASTSGTGPATPALATLQFVSPRLGWAAGRGRILVTADAGATWTAQYRGPEMVTLVDFVDARTGWAVGLDSLLGTTDGGRCWRRLGEPDPPLASVHFTGPLHGWGVTGPAGTRGGLPNTLVLGDGVPVPPAGGRLVVTDDGGSTWRAPAGAPADVQSACFSDDAHGWLGAAGRLYRSGDGGSTWHEVPGLPQQAGTQASVVSLQCAAPNSVWLLDLSLEGAAGNQPYAAYASTGGGPPVELFEDMFGGTVDRPSPGSYPGPLSVISSTTAAFAGNTPALPGNPAGFEEATVTGASVSISHVVRVPGIDRPTGAAFVSASIGWLVAEAGSNDVILATTDGGRTWTCQYSTPG
jgi:photosystem II stability/assembly factor-like uncharacterized protein